MNVSVRYRTSILKYYEKSVKTALNSVFSHRKPTDHINKFTLRVLH